MAKLIQANGNWVSGDRFWNREKDMELLQEMLDGGAHILLTAQRRMGKTSLMRELMRQLEGRYLCVFIDLQDASEAEDLIVKLSIALKPHDSYWRKIKTLFSNAFQALSGNVEELNLGDISIKLRAGLSAGNWREKGDALLSIVAESGQPVLLCMDEVPIMVNRLLTGNEHRISPEGRAKAETFMAWLRKNSLAHQGRIRMMLSGSIGFEPVLHRAGLSATINNFRPFDLKPWDEATAAGCLRALAGQYGLVFKDNAEGAMAAHIGYCVPHHVQMFFSHIYDRCKRRGNMVFSAEEVRDVYENEMLGVRGHAELAHYEERLKLVLGPALYPFALELLTETAVTGILAAKTVALLKKSYSIPPEEGGIAEKAILRVLEHDGYLNPAASGYVFASRLVRDWWERRHGYAYVPADRRGL